MGHQLLRESGLQMRAVIATPSGTQRVEVRADLAEPVPAPHEAVVAVESFSVNRGELALLAARPDGWRPGQDVAGTVTSAAADGAGPSAGARVVGLVEAAGWAQHVALRVDRLAVVPDGVALADAATLPLAGLTALRTLRLGGSVLGRRVLVTGAAGGVGHLQVQLAAASGAQVVAVSRRASAREGLLGAGAHAVVNGVEQADGSFDLILDGVGGRTLSAVISKAAPGATVVLLGASDSEPAQLTLLDFVGHENTTIRTYFSYANPAGASEDLAALLSLLHTGQLVARLGVHRSWTAINAVLDDLAAGRVDGKAVLDVN